MPAHDFQAAPPPEHCPACTQSGSLKKHALREAWWRDVPQDCRPKVRRGHLVRWRCVACMQTHTTAPDWAASPRRMTHDLAHWIKAQLQQGLPISRIAQASGIDHKTVRSIRQTDQTQ